MLLYFRLWYRVGSTGSAAAAVVSRPERARTADTVAKDNQYLVNPVIIWKLPSSDERK
jgi:hypothetical protein